MPRTQPRHEPLGADVLNRINRAVEHAKNEVEYAILREPTGPRRNSLTDANIHLMAAMEDLRTAAGL